MAEPSEKFKDLDFLVGRIGMPVVVLGFLGYFMWVKFEKFEERVEWKLERITRNTRAIMQKQGIPVTFDSEIKEPK